MKRIILSLLLTILAAVAVWLVTHRCCTRPTQPEEASAILDAISAPQLQPITEPTTPTPDAQVPSASAVDDTPVPETQQETQAQPNEPPVLSSDQALEVLRVTIRNYGQRFHGNPVGNNAEITRALNGKNPQQVNFLGGNENRINEKGELVDGWGTPYFFHQLSGTEMEIRSAGPDKKMWTADDHMTR